MSENDPRNALKGAAASSDVLHENEGDPDQTDADIGAGFEGWFFGDSGRARTISIHDALPI